MNNNFNFSIPETPSELTELKNQLVKHTNFIYESCQKRFSIKWKYPLIIRFALHYTTAGLAKFSSDGHHSLLFNEHYLKDNPEKFFKVVSFHEISHLITHTISFNAKPHGIEWGEVMKSFGLPPKPCHNYSHNSLPCVKLNKAISFNNPVKSWGRIVNFN